MNDESREQIFDAIFSSIFDPVAVYKVTGGEGHSPLALVYENVNEAYLNFNNLTKEHLIGKTYTDVWKVEEQSGWLDLMLRVAETGHAGYGEETLESKSQNHQKKQNSKPPSESYKETSSVVPGYYQLFAFTPFPGHIVAIFRDMGKWHNVAADLKEKEKLLLAYREDLRKLTIKLTLAEEKTRRSIAITLHDRIGYSMVSMLHTLHSLYDNLTEINSKNEVGTAIDEMENLLRETRSFTFEISPPLLYEVGLGAALEVLCDHLLIPHGIKPEFHIIGNKSELPEDTKILLYQMVRELLVNVVKHAAATKVLMKIRWGNKKIQILVEDNGTGFSMAKNTQGRRSSGMGLFSIRERLKTLGGKVRIVSEPSKGTTISLVAPTVTN